MLFYWNSSRLEMNDFMNMPADYIMFFMFIIPLYLFAAAKMGLTFLAQSMSMTMLYLWTRRNPNAHISIMGLVEFKA